MASEIDEILPVSRDTTIEAIRPASAKEVRAQYRDYIFSNFDRFKVEMARMHGEKYVRYFIQASKFVVPTVAAVRVEDERQATTASELIGAIAQWGMPAIED